MSPDILIDGRVIASVPDETGHYDVLGGLYINLDGINGYGKHQPVILEGEAIGGRRVIGLTMEGRGRSGDTKRGDGLSPEIGVTLLDKPIRISYRDMVRVDRARSLADPGGSTRWEKVKSTYVNPRWVRGYGQR